MMPWMIVQGDHVAVCCGIMIFMDDAMDFLSKVTMLRYKDFHG